MPTRHEKPKKVRPHIYCNSSPLYPQTNRHKHIKTTYRTNVLSCWMNVVFTSRTVSCWFASCLSLFLHSISFMHSHSTLSFFGTVTIIQQKTNPLLYSGVGSSASGRS